MTDALILPLFVCFALLVIGFAARAQENGTSDIRVMTTQGREVIVMPSVKGSGRVQSASGAIAGHSYETASQRTHVVYYEGRAFKAVTPLEGTSSRVVFDPSRRTFIPLLSSIRVELASQAQAYEIGELLDATKATFFDKLGFAHIDLPETLHPVDAVEKVQSAPGSPKATIRLQRPRPRWR